MGFWRWSLVGFLKGSLNPVPEIEELPEETNGPQGLHENTLKKNS